MFTYNGSNLYTECQVQIAHHPLYNHHLLRILLSKDGNIGHDHIEEFQHNGCHSAEMAGTGGPTEVLGNLFHRYDSGETAGIDFGGVRHKEHITALLCGLEDVIIKGTGVGSKILIGAKLGGIDKDAQDHQIDLGTDSINKG